jgi:hypothetical protein
MATFLKHTKSVASRPISGSAEKTNNSYFLTKQTCAQTQYKSTNMKKLSLLLFSLFLFNSCSLIKLIKHKNKEDLIASNTLCPFDIKNDKIILNTIFPNSEQHNMALDLGAGTTILLKNSGLHYIDSLQPELSYGKISSADNQKQKIQFSSIGSVETDALKINNAFLPLFPDFQGLACSKVVGVWGADAFDEKILLLRMQDSTIAVFDTLPSLKDWTMVESKYKYPHFYVILKVGTQKVRLLFDTGSSSGIVMSEDLYNEKIESQAQFIKDYQKWYGHAFNTASGLTAADTTITAILTHSFWGDFPVDSIPITISNKIKRSVMGMDVFKRFNILLDYSGNKIYIQNNPNFILTNEKMYVSQMGFNYRNMDGNKVIVIVIKSNSFAEKAGLKINDEIISINGISLDASDPCKVDEIFNQMASKENGNRINVKRGNETLTFIF